MRMNEVIETLEAQGQQFAAQFKRLDALEAAYLKGNRPALSGGNSCDRQALERGIRALFAGNQSKAYECFHESKAMSAGTDPSGGYLVVSEFSNRNDARICRSLTALATGAHGRAQAWRFLRGSRGPQRRGSGLGR